MSDWKFQIGNFDINADKYEVYSNKEQSMIVTAYQIVSTMVRGYEYTNARLTRAGFEVVGFGPINVLLDKPMKDAMLRIVKKREASERAFAAAAKRRENMMVRQASSKDKTRAEIKLNKAVHREIQSNINNERIVFRGNTYLNAKAICKAFNADINKFNTLREKGYSVQESLGLAELRDGYKLNNRVKLDKMLYQMGRIRGDY